ncbi:MAG TPA: hypothetical protein VIT65_13065 [Microlunatus sp.]
MSRRVKLPGASELFRPTGTEATAPGGSGVGREDAPALAVDRLSAEPVDGTGGSPGGGGTGRVRHEEKITVYVSRDELLAIEQARLRLRGELGLAVDRGRLVRAAMALALADLETAGSDGELVRRLTTS